MTISFRILKRLCVPEFACSWSSVAAFFVPGRQRIGSVFILLMLFCWPTENSFGAQNLECPEIGGASVPDLIGDTSGGGLFVSENRIDLANEINEAINKLQIANPNIAWTEVQNVLVAAYCRVVARKEGLTAAEKWGRMRLFDNVLERQIAASMMPAGTLIIASVPLPPTSFENSGGRPLSQIKRRLN
jgi:hypothetical protein